MEKRIVVWVQQRKDRAFLALEWIDPATGRCKSKPAETCNPLDAERVRPILNLT